MSLIDELISRLPHRYEVSDARYLATLRGAPIDALHRELTALQIINLDPAADRWFVDRESNIITEIRRRGIERRARHETQS